MPQLIQGRHFIKMDPGPAAEPSEGCMGGYYCVGVVSVDPRFFDVVGAPVIRGRALTTADAEQRTRVVLVNETFVEEVLGSRNPIGRRFRFASKGEPTAQSWYEIVGVVPDLSVSVKIGRAHVELQSRQYLVCRLLLEKTKITSYNL